MKRRRKLPKRKVRGNYKQSRKKDVKEKKFYTKDDIFISRMASILRMPKGKVRGVFSQRSVTTIRLNTLAKSPDKILPRLKSNGWEMEEVPWAPDTFIVTNKDKSELAKTQDYAEGLFYIQNLSSMLPVVILEANSKDKVLDMCAAPGSKTTMIAVDMKNKGEIIANDDNISRSEQLRAVLAAFFVNNTEMRIGDGGNLGKEYPDHFDKILLDAPCSGEGLIFLRKPKPLRFWTIKKIKIMAKIQQKLILSAYDALKPGGTLVYSTCTLEPQENEGVISFLLENKPKAIIEDLDIIKELEFKEYLGFTRPGITHWNNTDYDEEVKKTLRIIPGKKMQGFYIAKITKPVTKK